MDDYTLGRRYTPAHPHSPIGFYLWREGARTSHGFTLRLEDARRACRVNNLRGGEPAFPVEAASGRRVLP